MILRILEIFTKIRLFWDAPPTRPHMTHFVKGWCPAVAGAPWDLPLSWEAEKNQTRKMNKNRFALPNGHFSFAHFHFLKMQNHTFCTFWAKGGKVGPNPCWNAHIGKPHTPAQDSLHLKNFTTDEISRTCLCSRGRDAWTRGLVLSTRLAQFWHFSKTHNKSQN